MVKSPIRSIDLTAAVRHTSSSLVPKILTVLPAYDRRQFVRDLIAGTIVGIVAIPLAIAFAIGSGVTPDRGLRTAIVAGFLISALGGSRVQIGGPTGAFVVIVYAIVQKHGVDGLIIATLMAGVMLVIMGAAKLGSVIKFIPHPVIVGFTSGIAVIIFSGEVKDFLGLRVASLPSAFIAKWGVLLQNVGTASLPAVGVGLLTLGVMLAWPRINRRIPGPFIALVVATLIVTVAHVPVETIGSRFGTLSTSFPAPRLPSLSLATLNALLVPAFTIAMLGAIESLLSAVVADGMIGGRHRSNMELIAQGVANIGSALFGGIPATGAIARTATNVKNGGRTPIAGMTHALTLLIVALFAGRWVSLIPMASLGAILVVVAYHMSEWRTFVGELRAPKSDVAVLLVTFGLTVLVDLTVAIGVGVALAGVLFIRRMAATAEINVMTTDDDDDRFSASPGRAIPPGVEVYEATGPFFFGAAELFKETLGVVAGRPQVLVIGMDGVPAIDSTGMHALKDVARRSRREGTTLLLAGLQPQPRAALESSPILAELGADNVLPTIDAALHRAARIVAAAPAA
jgi:SulP family sulfate permease